MKFPLDLKPEKTWITSSTHPRIGMLASKLYSCFLHQFVQCQAALLAHPVLWYMRTLLDHVWGWTHLRWKKHVWHLQLLYLIVEELRSQLFWGLTHQELRRTQSTTKTRLQEHVEPKSGRNMWHNSMMLATFGAFWIAPNNSNGGSLDLYGTSRKRSSVSSIILSPEVRAGTHTRGAKKMVCVVQNTWTSMNVTNNSMI